MRTVLVVGGGLAAATAVRTLREEGDDARVVLVGDEPHLPYDRPPLSKAFLTAAEAPVPALLPDDWFARHDVEVRTGTTVTALFPAARRALLSDGDEVAWSHALLATGSAARRIDVPGAGLDGVRTLRDLDDARRLRADLSDGALRVVVVGGGWIGLEVAASARTLGHHVTVVEPGATVLAHVLGPRVGRLFEQAHRDHGVDVRTRTGVLGFAPERAGSSRVGAVLLSDGTHLPADLVVVGIGAVPRTGLAAEAGLAVRHGVVVDAAMRTSHPDVLAAGDIAEVDGARVDHWDNARSTGRTAAATILGRPADAVRPLPYFFSDQYDLGLEVFGHPAGADDVVRRGDLARGPVVTFWLTGGRVVAAMHVNAWDDSDAVRAVVGTTPDDVRRLADETVPLGELAPPAVAVHGRS